ncbi:MAG: hypothetical protein JST32_12085 [Bacteroidetes bacterium]|nr:hypothetical protein [Bacteroidota bacterium]
MKRSLCAVLFVAASIQVSSCSSDTQNNNLDANRNTVKKYHWVWSTGQIKTLDTILSNGFICHFIAGMEWKGIDGAKNEITSHRNHFPTGRKK